eukprot:5001387-Pyramimonas_sp.AAC.1
MFAFAIPCILSIAAIDGAAWWVPCSWVFASWMKLASPGIALMHSRRMSVCGMPLSRISLYDGQRDATFSTDNLP